jgi:hypothetical protein
MNRANNLPRRLELTLPHVPDVALQRRTVHLSAPPCIIRLNDAAKKTIPIRSSKIKTIAAPPENFPNVTLAVNRQAYRRL